jgi:proline racemase
MNAVILTSELPLLATGSSSGQPVACVDATSVAPDASALAGTLEQIRTDFFGRLQGDPGAIVAVLTSATAHGAHYGLRFVAADGPLGGCGEATMFATAVRSAGPGTDVVFETTTGPITGTSDGSGSVSLRMPTASAITSHQLTVAGRQLAVRTVSVAGNDFAVLVADQAGIGFVGDPSEQLAARGDVLRRSIGAALPDPPALLLLTEPVVDGSTRSVVVWGDAVLNVGPCGTGTCARLTVALEDGELGPAEVLDHYSPFGFAFQARLDTAGDPRIVISGSVDITR